MGLGKTVITLTALAELLHDSFEAGKVLIIAPLRVARDTWPQEITKWQHLSTLRFSTVVGDKTTREQALAKKADIYITNRENLPWLVDYVGATAWPFDMVVIDELSSFKNHQAKRFKALRSCRPQINRIVGLTGTPAPNGLLDLWAQFALLDGGQRLGRFITHYRNGYFIPDKTNGHQVFSYRLAPGAEQLIFDAISDITVSMKTTDQLELPPVTYANRVVTLSEIEKGRYRRLKKDLVLDVDGAVVDAANVASLCGKLLQLASGAIYTDEGVSQVVHSQKLDALAEIIESANGQTVLVAYWFTHERDRLLARFPQARALSTSEDMADWCQGRIPVGLIHPASAGHGLNLQSGGHILVWLTTPWSLELYEQTNARLFRQGQTEPVSVIHIVAQGTLDEQVLKALESKTATQTRLIDAVKAQLEEQNT